MGTRRRCHRPKWSRSWSLMMPPRQLSQLVFSHTFPLPPTEHAKSCIGPEDDAEHDADVPEETTASGRKHRASATYDPPSKHKDGAQGPFLMLHEHVELEQMQCAHSPFVLQRTLRKYLAVVAAVAGASRAVVSIGTSCFPHKSYLAELY